MKKTLIAGIAATTLAFAGIAFAQTTDTGTTPPQGKPGMGQQRPTPPAPGIRPDMRENERGMKNGARRLQVEGKDMRTATSTAARPENQKRMEENRKNMEEKRKKAGIERANAAIKRIERQVADMDKLATRIADRLATLKSKGADTSAAEAKLVVARTAITDAKAKVTAVTDALKAAIAAGSNTATSTNVNDIVKTVASQIRDAEKAIRDADKALRDAMKTRIPRPASTGTSTTATTTTQ